MHVRQGLDPAGKISQRDIRNEMRQSYFQGDDQEILMKLDGAGAN